MPGLGSLTYDLAANISRFERSLTKAEQLASKRSRNIRRTFSRMAASIGVTLGAVGFLKLAKDSLTFADSIDKAATRAGISATKLQELRFSAEQNGIAINQLDDGVRRFTRRLGVALQGGSFAKDFERLGVSIKDASGNALSAETVMDQVIGKMSEIENQAQRSAIAAQLFGDDAGPQLSVLMAKGEAAMEAYADKARSMGIIMEDHMIENAVEANDKLTILTRVIQVRLANALVKLAPLISSATEGLATLIDKIADVFAKDEQLGEGNVGRRLEKLNEERAQFVALLQEVQARDASNAGQDFLSKLWDPDKAERVKESINEIDARIIALELKQGELATKALERDGNRLNIVKFNNEEELRLKQEKMALETEMEIEHWDKLKKIWEKNQTDRQRFNRMSFKEQTKTILGEMITLTQGVAMHDKRMFEINKIASTANAIINTYESVTKTLAAYPYPFNIGLAALSAAAGFAQVSAIQSQSFGGGGAAPSLTAAGGGSATVNTIPIQTAGQGEQAREVFITIDGIPESSQWVRDLIENINDEIGDGAEIRAT